MEPLPFQELKNPDFVMIPTLSRACYSSLPFSLFSLPCVICFLFLKQCFFLIKQCIKHLFIAQKIFLLIKITIIGIVKLTAVVPNLLVLTKCQGWLDTVQWGGRETEGQTEGRGGCPKGAQILEQRQVSDPRGIDGC